MEVYVDDMLDKHSTVEQYVKDLAKTFATLRTHKMMLNPAKCTFGVEAWKFLGFMVSRLGIEANPEKIKAVLEMMPPKNTKEIQQLIGQIVALNRFISKSAERCLPFFEVFKKSSKFEQTMECQQAFDQPKAHLDLPPLLVGPSNAEELFVSLLCIRTRFICSLVKEEDEHQMPVYYISRVLQTIEKNYTKPKKLFFAFLMAA